MLWKNQQQNVFYTHTSTYAHTHILLHTHTHKHTHTHTHTHAHTHAHSHSHTLSLTSHDVHYSDHSKTRKGILTHSQTLYNVWQWMYACQGVYLIRCVWLCEFASVCINSNTHTHKRTHKHMRPRVCTQHIHRWNTDTHLQINNGIYSNFRVKSLDINTGLSKRITITLKSHVDQWCCL